MGFWQRAGLIGGTGFVGGNLSRQRPFVRSYSSTTIDDIAGEAFDTLVCAGAPAVMWAANADPEGDRRGLHTLAEHIAGARFDRLVLISTIAVLDDMAAGYTEDDARFETQIAYGRNRRELEEMLVAAHGATILRLPALFGHGLRKNYLFDLVNPLPSFIPNARFAALTDELDDGDRATLHALYAPAPKDMMKLGEAGVDAAARARLTAALDRRQATARYLTNGASTYQFYNLDHLSRDIDRVLTAGIPVLHVASPPLAAGTVHERAFGTAFDHDGPPLIRQDMRTRHAALWDQPGDYLYDRDTVLDEIQAFIEERR